MSKNFNVVIVSPEKIIYQGEVISLIVPSESGYLGVLADHAPLLANLASGKITLKQENGSPINFDYQGQGFLEVLNNNVSLLLNNSLSACALRATADVVKSC